MESEPPLDTHIKAAFCQLFKFPVFVTYFPESLYCNLLEAEPL